MTAVRLDDEQRQQLCDALLACAEEFMAGIPAEPPAGAELVRFILQRRPNAAASRMDDDFVRWTGVDGELAAMEMASLRLQAIAVFGYVIERNRLQNWDLVESLHPRAVAALVASYFGEPGEHVGPPGEVHLAWAASRETGTPLSKSRRDRRGKAMRRHRELWDEWLAAQLVSPEP